LSFLITDDEDCFLLGESELFIIDSVDGMVSQHIVLFKGIQRPVHRLGMFLLFHCRQGVSNLLRCFKALLLFLYFKLTKVNRSFLDLYLFLLCDCTALDYLRLFLLVLILILLSSGQRRFELSLRVFRFLRDLSVIGPVD
jgi:hypothetical protein